MNAFSEVGFTLIVLAALGSTPSSPRMVSESSHRRVDIVSARAFGCQINCESLEVKIDVINDAPYLLCVPEEYGQEFLAESIIVRESGGAVLHQISPTRGLYETSRRNEQAYISWLRLRPNYVLQPGGRLKLTSGMPKMWNFNPVGAVIELQLYTYPCDRDVFSRLKFVRHSIEYRNVAVD